MDFFNGLLLAASNNLCLLFFQTSLWLNVTITLVVVAIGFIFHRTRIGRLKHEKAELQRAVRERAELLTYSLEKEKKSRENAEQFNLRKSQLLARINHDIRTPLNGVVGMTTLLTQTPLSNEQREYTETILRCGESLLNVINNILLEDIMSYSKIESGKMELDQKEFDLRNNIEEVLDVFAVKAALAGLELLYQIHPDVPAKILGDDNRFRQILMNLIENSISVTRQGEILIEVNLLQKLEGNSIKLGFVVTDTGQGIEPEKLKQLSTDLSAGTLAPTVKGGMGLLICNKLVALMGGDFTIKSHLNKGTTVQFSILTVAGPQSQQNIVKDLADYEGKHILIVDDNDTFRNILGQQIQEWNLIPILAASGKEALTILTKTDNIDLVLTDRHMPEMDGINLAQSLREKYAKLPIILLSLATGENNEQNAKLFHSVLGRPIRQNLLAKHILSALRQGTAEIEDKSSKPKLSADFSQLYPLRILIAEDNPLNQELTKRVLGKLGYKADVANNGKEVLEVVSNTHYDLILMDIEMPQMDGLEASRMIRLCLTAQPVIIAMTANSLPGDRQKCLDSGMEDYISKPVHLEELVLLLEKWGVHVLAKR